MFFIRLFLFALYALPLASEANAASISLTEAEAKEKLLMSIPGLPVLSVKKSVLEEYFEVQIEGRTLYLNSSADYFIAGELFLINEKGLVNATKESRSLQRKGLLARLDETEMIVFNPSPKLTKATITVFTDIDCHYCRKLHQEVPKLNRLGVAVRYLAYPRAGIGSEPYNKAVSAWCADDPQEALTRAKAGKEIDSATCENPVKKHFEMGGLFGVTGTPAVLYEDGSLQAGYLPAEDMVRRLGIDQN
jgi:thiol:disulfide interchange protein DsbC